MKDLIQKVSEISIRYEHLSKLSGNDFNVFNVINVTTDEVRLHSRFIAELLNPKGSHGQGGVFLNLFASKFNVTMDFDVASVEVEKHIGTLTETTGGFIDIFISDNKGRSITIENKIYASDQKCQLLRYYNFNANNLLYLTLLGDEPNESSYIFNDDKKLDPRTDFKLISYKYDIKEWLIACRKEAVELPLLREGISHYINLIEILTGQSSNDIMNKEIRDYISENKDNLKQACLIAENLTDAKIKIQWLFWESLKDKMLFNGLEIIQKDRVTWQNVNNFYVKSRNRDIYYGFWVKIYEANDISLHFCIGIDDQVYIGFTIERKGKGGISNLEENILFKNMVLDLNSNYANNRDWLGWRYLKRRLDFRAFNSEAIFELADSKKLNKTTDDITEEILEDINALKTKLETL